MTDHLAARAAVSSAESRPSFAEAARVWLRIGMLGFGGPAGQIALMHREVVEERGWIDERRFLAALNFCMLLPGPEAQQLATYLGWLLHGWRGGLLAGTLFVLPGALLMLMLSAAYVLWGHSDAAEAVLYGLGAAVVALVFEAMVRVARRSLRSRATRAAACVAFVSVSLFAVPFPVVVAAALAAGCLRAMPHEGGGAEPAGVVTRSSAMTSVWGLLAGLAVWGLPLLGVSRWLGRDSVYAEQAQIFSQAAVVTFGGAYAVLAWVGGLATGALGWLRPDQMVDGLALAETTPGPLILVLQFVAFVGAYGAPEPLPPLVGGLAASAIALWATFVPSTLWIVVGAPWVERLSRVRRWAGGLELVTASVVGVIANLGLWFATHTLFAQTHDVRWGVVKATVPALASVDVFGVVLTVGAGVALMRYEQPLVRVLCAAVACAVAWSMVG